MNELSPTGIYYAPDTGGLGGALEAPKQPLKWGGVLRRLIQPLITETNAFDETLFDQGVAQVLRTLIPESALSIRANVLALREEFGGVLSEPEKVDFQSAKVLQGEQDKPVSMPVLRNYSIRSEETNIRTVRAQAFVSQGGKNLRDYSFPGIPDLHVVLEDVVPSDVQRFVGWRSQIEAALEDRRLSGEESLIAKEALNKYYGIWATRLKIVFGTAYWAGRSPNFAHTCSIWLLRMADDRGNDDRLIVRYGFGHGNNTSDIVLSSSGLGNTQPLDKLEEKFTKIYNAIACSCNFSGRREYYHDAVLGSNNSIGAFKLLTLEDPT
jgi:hypothetical protein